MLWDIINDLKGECLREKALELRQRLEVLNDQELMVFHCEAVETFRLLFGPRMYYLYSAAFEGEANGSGLTDFCSNLILSGRTLVDALLADPDNFANVGNFEPFNQDNGLDVSSIALQVLVGRHDEDIVAERCYHAGAQSLKGIWEALEEQVGSLDFVPDWRVLKAALPRIYKRINNSFK